MKKKGNQEQQLHISSFIKDPGSLKLLILAGTNIKQTELPTISKCTGLIKLDLSSNFLSEIPLKFSLFSHMRILYLHDNQLTHIEIRNTQLEYISIFKNPIQQEQYRSDLIAHNQSLLGIDYHVVTASEKLGSRTSLPLYTEIKWPIVETSSNLQHQDDYLNLLKAEIFVISNVHKRTKNIETIKNSIMTTIQCKRYLTDYINQSGASLLPTIIKVVAKWKYYTSLRRKLRLMLVKKDKEHLLYTRIEIKKLQRSEGVSRVLEAYIPFVRLKVKVRGLIQWHSRSFREWIPAQKQLFSEYLNLSESRNYYTHPAKLYFQQSQMDILGKVHLFAKKVFFNKKDYDLCDEYNSLIKETGIMYYIYRKGSEYTNERSWIMNCIHESKDFVLGQYGIDRRNILYTKKGHKLIPVKNLKKIKKSPQLTQRIQSCSRKMDYIYNRYDKLIQYQIYNYKILTTVLRILKYINAGNSNSILSNETAYFQTEVIFDEQKTDQNTKIRVHIGLEFFTKRVIAANIIQRSWRRYCASKRSIDIIGIIKKNRAEELISRWVRSRVFQHRMASLKLRSYFASVWREKDVYLQLDIYMNLPHPKNLLKFQDSLRDKDNLYQLIHKGTQVQIVMNAGKRWLKICYPSYKQSTSALIAFHKNTYHFAYGFYLKFFTAQEINENILIAKYEKNVKNLLKITCPPPKIDNLGSQSLAGTSNQPMTKTTLWVDNLQPFFIWSEVNAMQHFTKFEKQDKHMTTVNIFIYNKHKRPLKVSCQIFWTYQNSLYGNRNHYRSQKSGIQTPTKHIIKRKDQKERGNQDGDLSLIDLEKGLKSSLRKGRRSFLDKGGKLELSRDISRKNSLGSKNNSNNKSYRARIISDPRLQKLSQTLNIRGR